MKRRAGIRNLGHILKSLPSPNLAIEPHFSVGKTLKYLWYSDGFAALIWVTLTTSCSVRDFRMCPLHFSLRTRAKKPGR